MNEHTRSVMRQWTLAQPVVSAFITSIVRDFTDRDDVLQNTAVAVLESCSRYNSDRPFLAWALGVAQNQIRLYLRRCSRDRLLLDEGLVEIVAASFERVSSAEHLRQLEYLRECLAGLEDRERQLFELRNAQDLNNHEWHLRAYHLVLQVNLAFRKMLDTKARRNLKASNS